MNAIIETGGKQYMVKEGDIIHVEKLEAEAEGSLVIDKIVAIGEDGSMEFGAPYVSGATVATTVLKHGKGKKIIVYKMKPKKGYRKKQGHRQPYTRLQIDKISS